ncbi:4'-phosphopantetheinyl transferase family protein [Leifsonia sp. NPDC014704]|uniref:4'-phosphopantetheinyl transferase family protein n=1 Tax=Leifsonia sp. NPDC014704 TaxID=3364123 RepID=UPI0036F4681B
MPALVIVPHRSVDAALVARVSSRLSDGDRARLSSLHHDLDGLAAFVAGRAALQRALSDAGDGDARIDATCPDCGLSHGRPRAVDGSRRLYVSVSHAAGQAFAVAARHPIGIDAEAMDDLRARGGAIDELAPGRGDPARRWTAVEAVLKADGRGLRRDPGAVRVGRLSARLDGRHYTLRTTRAGDCLVTVATGLSRQP